MILHRSAGICLAVMLLMHQNECLDGVWQAAAYVKKHAVEEQVQWLMGAPAGYFESAQTTAALAKTLPQSYPEFSCISVNAKTTQLCHV